jgi:hypothetical protein|tara:strand:- start:154 stop:435 length:282 start_codon:yes stop_codon:yes gene_type:complete
MNEMKQHNYTLWINDELVATRDHTREGYTDLLAYAQESLADSPEIYSSRDEQAVWQADTDTEPTPSDEGGMYDDMYTPEPYEPNCYDGTYSEM